MCIRDSVGLDRAGVGRQDLHQLAVDLRVARHHLALVEVVGLAGEVADQAAGLGDDQRARGDVPGVQPGLEEAVVPARGDITQIERGRTRATHAGAGRMMVSNIFT